MKAIVKAVLACASKEVGVEEVPLGSNRGPRVDFFIRTGGGTPPEYWCCDFVSTMWDLALAECGLEKNLILNSPSCDVFLAWGKKHGLMREDPEPGDVFMYVPNAREEWNATHTGLIESVKGSGVLVCIEGNGSRGGSRNGIAVVRRDRANSHLRFIRPAAMVKETAEEATGYKLAVNGKALAMPDGKTAMPFHRNINYAPLKPVAVAMGADPLKVVWDDDAQSVSVAGEIFPHEIMRRGGVSYASVREVAEFLKLKLAWDKTTRTVALSL